MSNTEFDRILGEHCAPVLMGCKIANLVSVKKEDFNSLDLFLEDYRKFFSKQNLRIRVLCTGCKRHQLLLYRPDELLQRLYTVSAQKILTSCGYPAYASLEEYLEILSHRMTSNGDFPHEIGLFLGYPSDDILAFCKNKGKNYILCRYWKVYSNAEEASRIFKHFDLCREYMCKCLNEGLTLPQILKSDLCA